MPANTKTRKMIIRRHFLNRSWVTTPARFSMTRNSGNSKQSPKPMIIAIK